MTRTIQRTPASRVRFWTYTSSCTGLVHTSSRARVVRMCRAANRVSFYRGLKMVAATKLRGMVDRSAARWRGLSLSHAMRQVRVEPASQWERSFCRLFRELSTSRARPEYFRRESPIFAFDAQFSAWGVSICCVEALKECTDITCIMLISVMVCS